MGRAAAAAAAAAATASAAAATAVVTVAVAADAVAATAASTLWLETAGSWRMKGARGRRGGHDKEGGRNSERR